MEETKDEDRQNLNFLENTFSNELLQEKIDLIEVLQEQLEKEKEKVKQLNI